jgi:N-acetylglucosamine-6-phosphate deacetylase
MWQAIQNLSDYAGIPFEDALYAATMAPALEIGLESEIGSLEVGKRADLLVLDNWLTIGRIMCGGWWHK